MEDTDALLAELSAVQPDVLKLVTEGKTPIVNVKAGSKVERLLRFANSKMQVKHLKYKVNNLEW